MVASMLRPLAFLQDFWDTIVKLLNSLPEMWRAVVLIVLALIAGGASAWLIASKLRSRGRVKRLKKRIRALEQVIADAKTVEDVWCRPLRARRDSLPRFVPPEQRRARIVSVINIKGGVGKTTLASNLAAVLALNAEHPKKVLVVDLDLQATLTAECVLRQMAEHLRRCKDVAAKLLDRDLSLDEFDRLITPMNHVEHAWVVASDDSLNVADASVYAEVLLSPECEVRFRYLRLFHDPRVTGRYDLIIFDCPPRYTASSVNALLASDYVLIPTKLDDRSIDAIPQTLKWLERLEHLAKPRILGIIANEVPWWGGHPQNRAQQKYVQLQTRMSQAREGLDQQVFQAMVRFDFDVAPSEAGLVPALNPEVREWFEPVAQELRERLQHEH